MAIQGPRRLIFPSFAGGADSAVLGQPVLRNYTTASGLFAIAIAPDSDVDCALLLVDGDDMANRIIVSAKRPFFGQVAAGSNIKIVPIRHSWPNTILGQPDGYTYDDAGRMECPRLILETYSQPLRGDFTQGPMRGRTPALYKFDRVTGDEDGSLVFPVHGREQWSLALATRAVGGAATSVTYVIQGVDSVGDTAAGVPTTLTTLVQAIGDEDAFQYEGPPFDWIQIGYLANAAGTITIEGTVTAQGEE